MLKLMLYISVFFVGLGSALAQDELTFFSVIQDVPVMEGMVELEEQAFSFDKPQGQISETVADIGALKEKQVLYFYAVTLPQMGWSKVSDTQFFRHDEYLELAFISGESRHLMRIRTYPSR